VSPLLFRRPCGVLRILNIFDSVVYLLLIMVLLVNRSEANSLPAFFKASALESTGPVTPSDRNQNGNADGEELATNGISPSRTAQERKIGPQLPITSTHEGIYVDSEATTQTFYSDGVFFTRDAQISEYRVSPHEIENRKQILELSEHQTIYRNLLHHRFLLLRSTLRCSPPASAISDLDDAHPISFPSQVRRARTEWRRLLLDVDPQMVQLACMDETSVLAVLALLGRSLGETVKYQNIAQIKRTGAWVWGLLARCREVGQLGSEEVSEIRDLGKRAAKILEKLRTKKIMTE
jgi:hypothetical protein